MIKRTEGLDIIHVKRISEGTAKKKRVLVKAKDGMLEYFVVGNAPIRHNNKRDRKKDSNNNKAKQSMSPDMKVVDSREGLNSKISLKTTTVTTTTTTTTVITTTTTEICHDKAPNFYEELECENQNCVLFEPFDDGQVRIISSEETECPYLDGAILYNKVEQLNCPEEEELLQMLQNFSDIVEQAKQVEMGDVTEPTSLVNLRFRTEPVPCNNGILPLILNCNLYEEIAGDELDRYNVHIKQYYSEKNPPVVGEHTRRISQLSPRLVDYYKKWDFCIDKHIGIVSFPNMISQYGDLDNIAQSEELKRMTKEMEDDSIYPFGSYQWNCKWYMEIDRLQMPKVPKTSHAYVYKNSLGMYCLLPVDILNNLVFPFIRHYHERFYRSRSLLLKYCEAPDGETVIGSFLKDCPPKPWGLFEVFQRTCIFISNRVFPLYYTEHIKNRFIKDYCKYHSRRRCNYDSSSLQKRLYPVVVRVKISEETAGTDDEEEIFWSSDSPESQQCSSSPMDYDGDNSWENESPNSDLSGEVSFFHFFPVFFLFLFVSMIFW